MDSPFVKIQDILKSSRFATTRKYESPIELKLGTRLEQFGVNIETQKQIDKYRVDLFVKSKYVNFIIECDGAEFHQDKSKDQARDEYFRQKGLKTLRFTGRQIFKDTDWCVIQVIENISEIYETPRFRSFLERYIEKSKLPVEQIDEIEPNY